MILNELPAATMENQQYTAPAQTRIGHIHLKVSDLDQALEFYRDLLGFEVTTTYGDQAAFLSAGLFHTALLYPTRKDLATIVKRLMDAGYPISGASDHGVSEAIYLDDPDGNGVELYCDRPREDWEYNEDGSIHMVTEPLDMDSLLDDLND